VSIVIVNWNSREYLRKCIASILANTHRTALEIVVIDSASFDGAGRMLREHYPEVRFIQSEANVGFAKANNQAARSAAGEYLLFLNPDTELVGPAIDALHAAARALPDAGVVGCRLLNSDGTVQTSCIQSIPTITNQLLDSEVLRARWPKSRLWGMAALHDASMKPSEVEAISGACLMVKRKTFEQVGRFGEDYFMYAEDMDLSHKVREAGCRNYYVPDATVVHHGGSSAEQVVSTFAAVMTREAIARFLAKTRGTAYSTAYRAAMGTSAVGRLALLSVVRAARRNPAQTAAMQKWQAILRWSVRQDGIVERYYSLNRSLLRGGSQTAGS
jgi:GT2 family glycosyltransferase